MKFGHRFQQVIEQTHPSVSDQFLCYKTLKKCLKNIPEERAAKEDTPEGLTTAETNSATRGKKELITLTAEQRAFVKTLNDEMKKFNKFFMNAEEDLVMRERALGTKFHALVDKQSGKLVCVNDSEPTSSVTALKETRKAFADFHGELVLLEHWTSLNYTALVKILKKHDKRSRVRLRSPFLVSALQQPFYSTEVLTELIKKTELRFRKLHELTSEAEAAERLTNGERSAEKTAATEKRNKTHTKTPPALARTRAAISCWDGMKDEDSVKRPFGDGHTGILKASEPASKKVKA